MALLLGLAALAFLQGPSAGSAAAAPQDGQPWRVVYVEGGPWRDYAMNLLGLAHGLENLQLIEDGRAPMPAQDDDASSIWRWLAANAGGGRLAFLPDGFYSAGWDEERLLEIKQAVLRRLAAGEVDLVLAFGTAAGGQMGTAEHSTPTLIITATDPVAAGLSQTEERSGLEHVHVQVEAGKIERQLSIFHNFFRFKTLGVPLDVTPEGRDSMGAATIERLAAELGFELRPCLAELEIPDKEESHRNLLDCLERLSDEADAVYLTVSNGMIESRMADIMAPMKAKRRPTFSQKGPSETKLGVLMSLAEDDFVSSGRFVAETVLAVLSGRSPGSLNQLYLAPLTMALNLKTAIDIGWNPSFEALAAVDELYVGGSDELYVAESDDEQAAAFQ
ncbi:MAG: ABC transporter substrate-binding protein [Deltaproteobacteria bacterium]|nr:ABC transporter substrate-binding protein [Deltaproteobacteria bacterium]